MARDLFEERGINPRDLFAERGINPSQSSKPKTIGSPAPPGIGGMIAQQLGWPSPEGASENIIQEAANIGPGIANLFPGVNVPKFNFAPDTGIGKLTGLGGSLLGFGGAGKAINAIPKVPEALSGVKNILQQLPGMTGKRGNAIADFLGNLTKGGLYGAIEDSENQLKGGMLGATLGGAGHIAATPINYLLKTSGPAAKTAIDSAKRLFAPAEANALKDLQKIVTPEGLSRTSEARKHLGINLTPSEAMSTPQAQALSSKPRPTPEGQEYVRKSQDRRTQGESKAVQGMLREMSPAELEAVYETPLYKEALKEKIKPAEAKELFEDKRLKRVFDEMRKDKDWNDLAADYYDPKFFEKEILPQIDFGKFTNESTRNQLQKKLASLGGEKPSEIPTEIGFYDIAKRFIDSKIARLKERHGNAAKIGLYEKDLERLKEKTDNAGKTYPHARNVAEKRLYKESIENAISKDFSIPNLHKHLFGSEKQTQESFKKLMRVASPELRQKFEILQRIGKDIKEIPKSHLTSQEAKADATKSTMYADVKTLAKKLHDGQYNTALIKLLNSPAWDRYAKRYGKEIMTPGPYVNKTKALREFSRLLANPSLIGES